MIKNIEIFLKDINRLNNIIKKIDKDNKILDDLNSIKEQLIEIELKLYEENLNDNLGIKECDELQYEIETNTINYLEELKEY